MQNVIFLSGLTEEVDRQHAVLDLGRNLLAVYVVGQRETPVSYTHLPKVDKWVRKAGSWCEKACPRTQSGRIMIAVTAVVIVAGVVWLLRPRSEAVHYPICLLYTSRCV